MSEKICLFAGTTEGRKLAEYLQESVSLTVCVATEYGEILLDGMNGLTVRAGRMDRDAMIRFFRESEFSLIIDATHPYATLVTENIKQAAETTEIRLMRILREADRPIEKAVYVSSVSEARDYLLHTNGNILLTTGSKEISDYIGLDMSRVWARVLPLASSLASCSDGGIEPSHIIAMQGPFSEELTIAQLHTIAANYLVTKDSGKNGGFAEKIAAAKAVDAIPVIIGRPHENDGLCFEEALLVLHTLIGKRKRTVSILGAGVGSLSLLTEEAENRLRNCDVIVGAKRVTEALSSFGKPVYPAVLPDKIKEYLDTRCEYQTIAVVMSGDVGFYSGAKKLSELLSDYDVTLVPGISSVVYFSAKLGIAWDDATLISLHGREQNIVHAVTSNHRVIALTGGDNGVGTVCAYLCEYGLAHVSVTIGERLSYPNEKITHGLAPDFAGKEFDSLSILLIENEKSQNRIRHGIPDEEFIRSDVPMTKAEVRSVSLAKLGLDKDSVVYDIGAGTGSISVECALAAYDGIVYAIEKKQEAIEPIRQNSRKFGASNLCIITGEAPDSLQDLPVPTHAFIGGSSGKLKEILTVLLEKNPHIRIVVNAVTLETLMETQNCITTFGFCDHETVLIEIARSKKLGGYHLMTAQNPVYVITLSK